MIQFMSRYFFVKVLHTNTHLMLQNAVLGVVKSTIVWLVFTGKIQATGMDFPKQILGSTSTPSLFCEGITKLVLSQKVCAKHRDKVSTAGLFYYPYNQCRNSCVTD